jgi:hypothetical protein
MKRKYLNKQTIIADIRLMCFGFMLCFAAMSCSEAPIGQIPVDHKSPSPLTNVVVTPTNGGAYVTYTLPNEDDISYVKCEFTYNGKKRIVRSSIYKNYMEVDGLGEPEEIELKISVIDHSENASQPYVSKFIPLDPPMTAIFRSFKVEPAFGGVKVEWENPARQMVGISFLAANDAGELELKDIVYSSLPTGLKGLRGFNTNKRQFAMSIIDKFENVSDTFKIEMTPFYEVLLDKSKFADAHLLGDNISDRGSRPISNIWDGSLDVLWHTNPEGGYTVPQYFTIDLGITSQLTRVVLYNRMEYHYAQHNLRLFDIWGTDRLTHPITDSYWEDNSWKADWTLLKECEVIKPSGSPMGTNTAEDLAAHNAGFEYEIPQDVPKVHYLRFVVRETWGRTAAIHIAEISVFGDDR